MTDDRMSAAISAASAAKNDAKDDGRPQLREFIEVMDERVSSLQSSALASHLAGYGAPGSTWGRLYVVNEAIYKFLLRCQAHESEIARILRGEKADDRT
jgi:hypothetical protein